METLFAEGTRTRRTAQLKATFSSLVTTLGGALVFETGERFEERDVWHGPMKSRDYYHWNEEILPVPGSDEPFCKYAVVAYAHEGTRLVQRRPKTRLARAWKALRRLLDGCKRRYSN